LKSYTSERRGFVQFVREARHLAIDLAGDVPGQVALAVERLREIERLASERLDMRLEGLKMLDVGAGQMALQMTYFSQRNEVVGIDLDVIVHGPHFPAYFEMLRRNGAKRVMKTVGRKALLIDARYHRELARQLGVHRLSRPRVARMDASNMSFADQSFDFVYSLVVFQHLDDPAMPLGEMARVLKPGGGLYLDFLLYTGRTGSHDVRYFTGKDAALPSWAHLRPQFEAMVHPNAHLNRLRLPEWQQLLEARLPGCELVLIQPEADRLGPDARTLRDNGELTDYSLDELLTSKVAVLWRKPPER
jgi:SAM-dependent methyltransferase